MAALWSVGSVGVYVDGLKRRKDGIWAEIDIIDATTTTMHYYGAKSVNLRVHGHLWGASNITEGLELYCNSSTSITFSGPNEFSETVKLKNVEATRIPDKTDVTNEFFSVDMEMVIQ